MFETSIVHAQVHARERRAGLLTFSFAAHGLVIVAVVLAGLHSTNFPKQAPKEMAYPLLPVPVSIPAALGTPSATPHHTNPTAPKMKPAETPSQPTAPQSIPESVQPAPALPASVIGNGAGPLAGSPSDGGNRGVSWGTNDGVGVEAPPATTVVLAPPLRVSGDVRAPTVVRRVQPLYPRVAVMGRMSGTVVVECIIDRNGQVRDTRVVRSTFAPFEQPALDAVRQWVFTPGSLHGQAIDTIFELTVTFRITPQ